MKKQKWLIIGLLAIMTVTGCGNKLKKVDTSTVYITEKGTVSSMSIEEFDKEYYSEEELDAFIQEEIKEVNDALGDDSVKLEDFSIDNGVAKAMLSFSDAKAYNEFNDTDLEAGAFGSIEIEGTLIRAENNNTVKPEEIESNDKLKVIKVNEAIQVMVDGKIVYYSEGAELIEKNVIKFMSENDSYVVYQ